MDKDCKEQLLKELIMEGASQKEAEDLLPVAGKISLLAFMERSFAAKRKFLENSKSATFKKAFWPKWFFVPAVAFVLLLLVGTTSIVRAQASLPGDSLYSIKRLSENVYSTISPQFKNEMLLRRSREIKTLVTEQKNSPLLKNTVAEYKKEAKDESQHEKSNMEESQKILEEAKDKANEQDKEEIKKAIISEDFRGVKGEHDSINSFKKPQFPSREENRYRSQESNNEEHE